MTEPLQDAFEVTHPDRHRFISKLPGTQTVYSPVDGYTVNPIRGYDDPGGLGFVIVERVASGVTSR